jgi:chloride channel, nucleotide-sensitive, 1A
MIFKTYHIISTVLLLAQSTMEAQARPIPVTIRSPPAIEDYTSLDDHQSQTPATFFGGKPVLHYQIAGATALVPESQRRQLPFFQDDSTQSAPELLDSQEELVAQKVDVFVNSE